MLEDDTRQHRFLSPPPSQRASFVIIPVFLRTDISIHALFAEGDPCPRPAAAAAEIFLSTPSSQRATTCKLRYGIMQIISIHALFAEGDVNRGDIFVLGGISIHALFAEGDVARAGAYSVGV